jgi:hypothetical protein
MATPPLSARLVLVLVLVLALAAVSLQRCIARWMS